MGLARTCLGAVLLAGCYSPHFPVGAPCNSDQECPSTQRCVGGTCGGSEIMPDSPMGGGDDASDSSLPVTDSDGDGIANAIDNCVDVANPMQGNEDADKLGDACDPCPIEMNDTPSDPDGDGVADSCDPNPNTAGDQIVLFEGFHAGVPGGWLNSNAVQVGDDVRLVASGTTQQFIAPPLDATTKMTVMTRVTIESTSGNNDADFGLSIPYNPANDAHIACELYSPTASSTNNRDVSIWDSINSVTVGSHAFAWVVNTPYLVTMQRAGTTYTCRANAPGSAPTTASGTSNASPATQKIGLRNYAESTLISYLLVVTSP